MNLEKFVYKKIKPINLKITSYPSLTNKGVPLVFFVTTKTNRCRKSTINEDNIAFAFKSHWKKK